MTPQPVPGRSEPATTAGRSPLIPPRAALRVLFIQATLVAVVAVAFLYCYAGLQRNPQPHRLPFAVVGTTTATRVRDAVGTAIAVAPAADDVAARHAVEHHDAVAGLSFLDPTMVDLYVAGPNGLAENAAAEAIAQDITRSRGAKLRIVDLIPTGRNDPRALNSFYIALSATVASFILAQAMFAVRQITRLRAQLITLAGFAVVIGAVLAITSVVALDLIPVEATPLALVLAAISVSVSLSSRALAGWFGSYGITAATLAMTAVGLPTSGGILGPNLLPAPLATLGAVLPPGLGLRVIVSLSYFHGAGALGPLLGLAAWAAAGLTALVLHRTTRPPPRQPARDEHPTTDRTPDGITSADGAA
jgi:hypothetical protein